MSSKPSISLVMPTYNRSELIGRSLDHLLKQTYQDITITICDNASTDNTRSIVESYMRRDSRVSYYCHAKNTGMIYNFRFYPSLAQTEYFMWAADDDVFEENYIEELWNTYHSTPDCILAFCSYDWLRMDGSVIGVYDAIFQIPDADRVTRLMRYLQQEESQGKANVIYGLMQTEHAQKAAEIFATEAATWGSDMLFVFYLLTLGNLGLTPKRLFHKFGSYQNLEPSPAPPVWKAIRDHYRHKGDWKQYYRGYEKLIRESDLLSATDQSQLLAVLTSRRAAKLRHDERVFWKNLLHL